MILAQLVTTINLPNHQFFLLTRFTDDPGHAGKTDAWSVVINPADNGLYSIQFVAKEAPTNDLKPDMTIPLWRGPNYVGHAIIQSI